MGLMERMNQELNEYISSETIQAIDISETIQSTCRIINSTVHLMYEYFSPICDILESTEDELEALRLRTLEAIENFFNSAKKIELNNNTIFEALNRIADPNTDKTCLKLKKTNDYIENANLMSQAAENFNNNLNNSLDETIDYLNDLIDKANKGIKAVPKLPDGEVIPLRIIKK